MKLDGIRQKVFLDRYSLKDIKGAPIEKTPDEMWKRVAKGIASVEKKKDRKKWEKKFFEVMDGFKFLPGGRILAGAGTGFDVTYYNCFVIPNPPDSRGGIMQNLTQMIEIMAHGGGVGLNLSSLRPRGSRVKKVNGFSSGPLNWAELYSLATKDIVQQGGCFTKDAKIMTHKGLISIEDIVGSNGNYFAQTHKGLKKITAKFDNGIKEVFEVETLGGYKVKVTKDHKFLTFTNNGNFYLKRLSDLLKGDSLVLLSSIFLDEIPEVLLKDNIARPSKFSYGRRTVNFPKTLTKDLAFVLGVYAVDGSRVKDEYAFSKGLRFAVDAKRKKDLKLLVKTISSLFGVTPILRKGDGNVIEVSLYSRNLVELLRLNNLLKENSNKVFVPEQIFSSPKSVVEAFIAGVFFGDGGNRGGKGGFRITSVNKKFTEDIQLLLLNLGVASKLTKQVRGSWQDLYTLNVNGAKFMKRFLEIVAPFNEKAFDNAISTRDAFYNFPINVVKRFAYLSGIQRTIAYTNPTTSYKTLAFMENNMSRIDDKDIEDTEILTSTISDKIKKITKLGLEQVYDLEVGDVHLLSGNGFYTSNSRRGALMLMLNDWHPDIEEFITVKQDLNKINGANLSVCISDAFMEAIKKDADWDLVFADLDDKKYDKKWTGDLDAWRKAGGKVKVVKTVKAKYLWDLICTAAWKSAEPGLHFLDRSNKRSNTWYFETLTATNPCLTADTWVHTNQGPRQISDLIGKQFVARVNGADILSGPQGFFKTATKPVIHLKTKEGYSLRLTKDHLIQYVSTMSRYSTKTKWREAGKLQKGDLVVLQNHSSNNTWEGNYSHKEGYLMGMLIGDGTLKQDKAVLSAWLPRRTTSVGLTPSGQQAVMESVSYVAMSLPHRVDFNGWSRVKNRGEYRLSLASIKQLAEELGMRPGYKTITKLMEESSSDFYKGLLKGLFDTDGSVQGNQRKGVSIRLAQSDLFLLEAVQRMLLRLGITSRIYKNRRQEGTKSLPDGKGATKEYHIKAQHELVISGSNVLLFSELINFEDTQKSSRLRNLLGAYKRKLNRERFVATVESLELDGKEDVFDVQIPNLHAFDANGFHAHNCGEQPLSPWAVCNLGAMNLAAYVDKKGVFDYDNFGKDVRVAVRFLDNVIDDTHYFYKENEKVAKDIRRQGLGILGLADALIKMKIKYGAEDSLVVIEKIFKTLRDNAYIASSDIAAEKGSFPRYNRDKYQKGWHIKRLPEEIKKKIYQQGIRNAVLLTIAPTGTTSLISGVSSGVEPVYEFEFIRRDRLGEHMMYHPLFDEWKKENPDKQKPDYFVSANDLTPEEHVKVQAVAQNYIDSSISKTVNAPKKHTVEDVKKLYEMAFDMGLKGITYMRDGSREGVLSRKEDKKEEVAQVTLESKLLPVIPRPAMVEGVTYGTETPVGKTYITINHDEKKQPFEVFITVGKSGSDVAAMADALGRMISLALRINGQVAPRERMRQVVAQIVGIGGARSVGFGENRVRSLPDAVAKVLSKHFEFRVNGIVEDKNLTNGHANVLTNVVTNGNGHAATKANTHIPVDVDNKEEVKEEIVKLEQLTLQTPAGNLSSTSGTSTGLYDICPECGGATLAYEEGCKKCYSCGYSEC